MKQFYILSLWIFVKIIFFAGCSQAYKKESIMIPTIVINGKEKQEDNKKYILFSAVSSDKFESVKNAIEKYKVSIHEINRFGCTALHFAIYSNHENKILLYLLAQGANIDHQDKKGNTALHKAVRAKRLDVVKILLDHHASIEIKNQKNKTPYDYAKRSTQEIALLIVKKKYAKELPLLQQGNFQVLQKVLKDQKPKSQKKTLTFLLHYQYLSKQDLKALDF